MTRIVQIVPSIGPGSGVAGVAWNLDQQFRRLGVAVETFTYDSARQKHRRSWKHRWSERAAQSGRVIWFSTVGTRKAREFLAARPDAVAICHNSVMTGDVYVNHGVVAASMKARGRGRWRMLRNPNHWFTYARDRVRYRSDRHRVVVALTEGEIEALRRTYGHVKPETVVIPNGVDLDRFRPPSDAEREAARARFQLAADDRVALFIGHEYDRKGLPIAIDALVEATTVLLMVVGGDGTIIARAREHAERVGVADRVLFVGPQRDLFPYLSAADMFVLPSAYESSGLVFLEALASGVPIVATAVGAAAEIVVDGENGFLVARDPHEVAERLERIAATDISQWRAAARISVEAYGWEAVARRYVELAERIAAERGTGGST